MQPQHRTTYIRKTSMQSVAVAQVDGALADALAAVVALVVGFHEAGPLGAGGLGAVFAEADVDDVIAVGVCRLEGVDGCSGGRGLNELCEWFYGIPAAELAASFGLAVHGGAQGNDTRDLDPLLA